jgi:hypothetical protein
LRHDPQVDVPAYAGCRLPIQLKHLLVGATDDQQGGRGHSGQCPPGQVRPTAAGDDQPYPARAIRGRSQSRRRSRTCAEDRQRQRPGIAAAGQPVRCPGKPLGQRADVEAQLAGSLVDFLPFGVSRSRSNVAYPARCRAPAT